MTTSAGWGRSTAKPARRSGAGRGTTPAARTRPPCSGAPPATGPELLFAYSGMVAAHDPASGERLWRHTHDMWQVVGGLVVDGDVVCAVGGAHAHKGNLCLRVTGGGRGARIERLW